MENQTEEEKFRDFASCPCCDAVITRFEQFPLIEITQFQRLQLPELIKGLAEKIVPLNLGYWQWFKIVSKRNPTIPNQVHKMLEDSNQVAYQGSIYEKISFMLGRNMIKEDLVSVIGQEEFDKKY